MRKPIAAKTRPLDPAAEQADIPVWKSRIGWRIAVTVFLVTMWLQGARLYDAAQKFEERTLVQHQALARAAIAQHISPNASPPLTRASADRIMATTPVRGLTLYNPDGSALAVYGETAALRPASPADHRVYRTQNEKRYEVIYPAGAFRAPASIIAVIDTEGLSSALTGYVGWTVFLFVVMSLLATAIVMLALRQWLLGPVLTLRRNLVQAARDPKNPEIIGAGREGGGEVGAALRLANALIRKNAANVKQMERQTEEKIHRLAYYDALTGLPNRTLFVEKLEEAIRRKVRGEERRLSVFFFDLDDFRELNATMGHDIGDRLLEAVGRRLSGAAPAESDVARLSGDEFVIMTVPAAGDENGSAAIAKILDALAEPINILQEEFRVRLSVGVATAPSDGRDAATLMKNADIALKRAKEQGGDCVRFYSEELDSAAQKRFKLLSRLREALQGEELSLSYQPQFDLKTGGIVGVEGLLRWEYTDANGTVQAVPTEEFVTIAEQTGLIIPIGEWVLRTACKTYRKWREAGMDVGRIAVNISTVQFNHGDIVKSVARILQETNVEPQHLELEITESALADNPHASVGTLRQLHELGVRLALDDFGTGQSSLATLRLCPLDRIKISTLFIRHALLNPQDAAVVRSVISIGHHLGVRVLAEGVETADHAAFLKKENCDEAQGFRYIQPLSAEKLPIYAASLQKPQLQVG